MSNGTVLLVSFLQCAALLLPFRPETCRGLESRHPPVEKVCSARFLILVAEQAKIGPRVR